MTRAPLALALLLALALPAAAQPQPGDPIRLTVSPAGPPARALKYQLLPELRDQGQGNAVLHYHRAALLMQKGLPDADAPMWKWMELPLRELPRDEVRRFLGGYAAALREVEEGARSTYCEWGLAERIRKEGISLLLPEIQRVREFASLLKLRARLEMADGRLDKAARTLQTGFALARHTGEAPTLISSLVGIAIASIMAGELDLFVQQSGAPNLYWALTDLPRPFIDLRRAFQGERLFLEGVFPGPDNILREARSGRPLTPEQVQAAVKFVSGVMREGDVAATWQAQLYLIGMAVRVYPEARRHLLEQGRTAEQVDAMPMVQVVLLHGLDEYERLFDEMAKWQSLPYAEARAGLARAEQLVKEDKVKASRLAAVPLASLLLPAVQKVTFATARLDRRVAALRAVEALRLHAAANGGKLPASLDAVKEAPVPLDPVTGKPFEYQVDGDRATLTGPPPEGEQAGPHNTLRYEVTIKR